MKKFKILFALSLAFFAETSFADKTNSLPKALVFYASDHPSEFVYFSTFFTEKLNEKLIYNAVHDQEANQTWLQNAKANKKDPLSDENQSLQEMTKELKKSYKDKNTEKMISENKLFRDHFFKILRNNPVKLEHENLLEFSFWSGVAEILQGETDKQSLWYYQKYSSVSSRNILESQLSEDTIKLLLREPQQKQKTLALETLPGCSLIINGQPVHENEISLPLPLKSVLWAHCPQGIFSQIFVPQMTSFLRLSQFQAQQQSQIMPDMAYLPLARIQTLQAQRIVFLYWSKQNQILQLKVYKREMFKLLIEKQWKVKSPREFPRAINDAVLFLQKSHQH